MGPPPFAPAMRVCRLLDAYGVGVCSSRKLAQAGERHLAFIALVGQERPDFRPRSAFRQLPLDAFPDGCVHVLRVAGEAGRVPLGTVAPEGPKLQGTASRHKARSSGSMQQAANRVHEALEPLVPQAHQQEAEAEAALGRRRCTARRVGAPGSPLGHDRGGPAAAGGRAKAAAEAERKRTGTTRGGKAPTPVAATPDDKAQRHGPDPALQSMRTNHTGWEACGKAPARVEAAPPIILACDVTAEANAKQPAAPMAPLPVAPLEPAGLAIPTDAAGPGRPSPATEDRGYSSAAAAVAVARVGVDPDMATGRQRPPAAAGAGTEPPPTAKARRATTVRTPAGRALSARRKGLVAPGFGQRKDARGFRRLLRRGLANIRGEWRLGCLTPHRLKLWRYECAPSTV